MRNTTRLDFVSAVCRCGGTTTQSAIASTSFVLAVAQGVLGGVAATTKTRRGDAEFCPN